MDFNKATINATLLSLAVSSNMLSANTDAFKSITNIGVEHVELVDNNQVYIIDSTYYFTAQATQGPLDENGYLNDATADNIFVVLLDGDDDIQSVTVGGAIYFDKFVIGGSFSNLEVGAFEQEVYELNAGYYFTENLLFSAFAITPEDEETSYEFSAEYQYLVNDIDYLGVTVVTDEHIDSVLIDSKYFKDLGGDTYLNTSFSLADAFDENIWQFGIRYYFSKFTALGGTVADDQTYGLEFTHFFNKHFALQANGNIIRDGELEDSERYYVGLTAQF